MKKMNNISYNIKETVEEQIWPNYNWLDTTLCSDNMRSTVSDQIEFVVIPVNLCVYPDWTMFGVLDL
jgi:hypothetical protein